MPNPRSTRAIQRSMGTGRAADAHAWFGGKFAGRAAAHGGSGGAPTRNGEGDSEGGGSGRGSDGAGSGDRVGGGGGSSAAFDATKPCSSCEILLERAASASALALSPDLTRADNIVSPTLR